MTYGSLEKLHNKVPDPTEYLIPLSTQKLSAGSKVAPLSIEQAGQLCYMVQQQRPRHQQQSPLARFQYQRVQTRRKEEEGDVITISSLFPQTTGL